MLADLRLVTAALFQPVSFLAENQSVDPSIVKQLALGVLPPAAAGLATFTALWWRRSPAVATEELCPSVGVGGLRRSAPALLLALGGWPMLHLLFGPASWPPRSSFDWLLPTMVASGVLLGLLGFVPFPRLRGPILLGAALLLLLAALLLSARNLVQGSWSATQTIIHLNLGAALGAIFLLGLERLVAQPGRWRLFAFAAILAAASQVLVLGHFSLKLGQVVGVIAAFAGGAFLISLARPSLRQGTPLALTAGLVTTTALWQAHFFGESEQPLLWSLPIVAAPWALVAIARFLRQRKPATLNVASAGSS